MASPQEARLALEVRTRVGEELRTVAFTVFKR
jgi:hypothetical protein